MNPLARPLTLVLALSLAAPSQAYAAPAADPWPATFPADVVGTHLVAQSKLIVLAANAQSAAAAAALHRGLTASKQAALVMDGQAVGGLDGLDDRAIVERAKGQPVDQIVVVRVFEAGAGEAASVVVTFYRPDGGVATAITGSAGTPVAPGSGTNATTGVSSAAADAVAGIDAEVDKADKQRSTADAAAQRRYDAEHLWVQNWIGVSIQTGAVVATWSAIKQGDHGEDVRGSQLYKIIGRDDLLKKYRTRQAVRLGVGFPVMLGGIALTSVGMGVLLSNVTADGPDYGYDDPLMMGSTDPNTKVSNAGAYGMIGGGAALMLGGILVISLLKAHPVSRGEAGQLIRDYNEGLRKRLGLPDPEARVRVAPMVGVTTQGLAVSGRF